jgi:hypothetical protein
VLGVRCMGKALGAITLTGIVALLGWFLSVATFKDTQTARTEGIRIEAQRHNEELALRELADRRGIFLRMRKSLMILQQNYGHRAEIATPAHWELRHMLDEVHSLRDRDLNRAIGDAIQASYDVDAQTVSLETRHAHSQILSDALALVETADDRYPLTTTAAAGPSSH